MARLRKTNRIKRKGVVMILALIFMAIFASLSIAMLSMSSANAQIADNHRVSNKAMNAAQSGLECAKYITRTTPMISTNRNWVSVSEADATWVSLCQRLQSSGVGGVEVPAAARFVDSETGLAGDEIVTGSIAYGNTSATFTVRFFRYDATPMTISIGSIGSDKQISRNISSDTFITKNSDVMQYAIASRGRMWLTGDSTVHGPILSTWDKPEWGAPVVTTSETIVEGTIGTVLGIDDLVDAGIQMETLDEDGNPVFDEDDNRVYSEEDSVQGDHEGIQYDANVDSMPGLDEDDYDTSLYEDLCTDIAYTSDRELEYFPHKPGDYKQKKDSWNYTYDRYLYEDQTFTNARLPRGRNALFRNCTFEEVLFIESTSNTDRTSRCNNVRFENCQFNGVIVTDVPINSSIKWVQNCLYFTGEATFDNTSSIQEAIILAPNFNVNLGNTGIVEEGDGNVLTGAIIGGIVDVRGNADIDGTIISMYDTTNHSSGYVTNIGFADDGGSEGGVPGDVGTITITPEPEMLLPSGITSPITINVLSSTYSEEY